MSALPFISVVVPTRNRAALLEDCLGSLLAQDYPAHRYEIVVVDDGSEDGTGDLVGRLARRTQAPAIQHCRQLPGGLNRARNSGIRRARGVIVGFVDDDELAPPALLREAVRLLEANPWAAAGGGWCRVKLEAGGPPLVCRECANTYKGIGYPGQEEAAVDAGDLPGGCLFAPRESFERYGMFSDPLSGPGDDSEWCARVRRQGGRLVMGRDVWVWHRVLPADLRFRGLWMKCVLAPRHLAKARRAMGWTAPPAADVRQAVRFLAHGVSRGCSVGLAQAAGRLLLAWEWSKARRQARARRVPEAGADRESSG